MKLGHKKNLSKVIANIHKILKINSEINDDMVKLITSRNEILNHIIDFKPKLQEIKETLKRLQKDEEKAYDALLLKGEDPEDDDSEACETRYLIEVAFEELQETIDDALTAIDDFIAKCESNPA